jgi:hypothetical protein
MDFMTRYRRECEACLASWEQTIDALQARGAELPAAARASLDADLRAFREMRALALARLAALEGARHDGNPDARMRATDQAWTDLARTVDGLMALYR